VPTNAQLEALLYAPPPPHPLTAIRAKLDRGDKHVRGYERWEHRVFAGKNPPGVQLAVQIDRKQSRGIIKIGRVSQLPIGLALLIGDAVHNYRSALDQLIFELAFIDSNGGKRLPPKASLERTMFPDSNCRENFEGTHVQTRLLAGLTKKHRAQLKRFQPYRARNRTMPHPIRLLVDLSNDDKHRLTQPVLACASNIHVEILDADLRDCRFAPDPDWQSEPVVGLPLQPGAKVCSLAIVITGTNPQMKVKGSLTRYVGFANGVPVSTALREIGQYARGIVEFFAPEFERPTAVKLRGVPRPGRIEPPTSPPLADTTSGVILAEDGLL
jgi:hypothetical protein